MQQRNTAVEAIATTTVVVKFMDGPHADAALLEFADSPITNDGTKYAKIINCVLPKNSAYSMAKFVTFEPSFEAADIIIEADDDMMVPATDGAVVVRVPPPPPTEDVVMAEDPDVVMVQTPHSVMPSKRCRVTLSIKIGHNTKERSCVIMFWDLAQAHHIMPLFQRWENIPGVILAELLHDCFCLKSRSASDIKEYCEQFNHTITTKSVDYAPGDIVEFVMNKRSQVLPARPLHRCDYNQPSALCCFNRKVNTVMRDVHGETFDMSFVVACHSSDAMQSIIQWATFTDPPKELPNCVVQVIRQEYDAYAIDEISSVIGADPDAVVGFYALNTTVVNAFFSPPDNMFVEYVRHEDLSTDKM
jgi:hypothetical protein